MRTALEKEFTKKIFNKTAKYYDVFHNLGTLGSDQRGRSYLIKRMIEADDFILDAGGGTGISAINAGKLLSEKGKIIILDYSEKMLHEAWKKITMSGNEEKFEFRIGDMYQIPYPDETFDKVISTYSLCPLEDPLNAVKEMLRVLKKGGLLGIAHSTDPKNKFAKLLSDKFEILIWKFPRLSLGCRNISVLEDIKKMNIEIVEEKIIGFVPFFFQLIIIKKL